MSALAVQEAIYARLAAALAPTKVYDHPPQQASFPYVTVGDDTQIDWDAKDAPGLEHTLTIHAWSRYRGRKEVKGLLATVVEALRGRLDLADHWNLELYPEFQTTMLDPDGITYHGVIRFRALTHAL